MYLYIYIKICKYRSIQSAVNIVKENVFIVLTCHPLSPSLTCNTHIRLADFVDVNTACFMSASFKQFTRISFFLDNRKANFVAYKPFLFLWLKRHWQDFTVPLFQWVASLYKYYILGGQWYWQPWNSNQHFDLNQFNNLHVEQAALAMIKRAENQTSCLIHLQRCGLQSSLFILSSFSWYPQTWQDLSGVWHRPHLTKHKDLLILLLHCEGLLAPPSQSSNLHTVGWQGWPWGTPGIKEALLDIYQP